jgi:hypothetical protein
MKYKITSYQYPLSEGIEAESIDEAIAKLLTYHPIAKESKTLIVIVEWGKGLKQLFLANGKIVPGPNVAAMKASQATNKKTEQNLNIETNGLSNEIVIKDINMPFWSMVGFMVKWSIASVPALLILSLIIFIIYIFLGALIASALIISR